MSWLHTKSEMLYSNYNNWLQIPSIIMSAVLGAASMSTTTIFPMSVVQASVAIGVLNICVSIAGILNTYFEFAKRSNGHKMGSVQYAQIHRMIHIEMSLPRDQRMAPKIILRYIKDDLKRLMEVLPRVPDKVVDMYKREIVPKSSNVSHPEVTNGIHPVVVYSAHHGSEDAPSPRFITKSRRNIDLESQLPEQKKGIEGLAQLAANLVTK
jgi:hypothetical protein